MKNYKELNCCGNCKHSIWHIIYSSIHCNVNKDVPKAEEDNDTYYNWCDNHWVVPYGTCDLYERDKRYDGKKL